MTTESSPESQIEALTRRRCRFNNVMLGISASGVLMAVVLALVLGAARTPMWLVVVAFVLVVTPLVTVVHGNWNYNAAINLQRSVESSYAPIRRTISLGSSVATKFTKDETQGNVRMLITISAAAVVILLGGEAMINWLVSTGASSRLASGLVLMIIVVMSGMLLWGIVSMWRSNRKLRKLNRDVLKSLRLHGYEWVNEVGILPGNVYTAERPALLKDFSGNYSQWVIEWNGQFAKATWLDPELSKA